MKNAIKQTQLNAVAAALQKQFKPDTEVVRKAFNIVELSRSSFAVNALKFGLCALSAKSLIGHGKFGRWLSDALSENGNSRPLAERTARDYMGIAKVFLEKLSNEQNSAGVLESGVEAYCAIMDLPRRDFKLSEVLANPKDSDNFLKSTVGDMTLSQLRQLLREGAERSYIDAQAEKSARQETSKALPKETERQNPQMLLWEDWTNELGDIDNLVRHTDKLRLSNDQYKLIVQKLRATADEIESFIRD